MITFRGLQAFFQELYLSLVQTNITARYYECPRRDLVPRSFSSSISARTRAETTLVPHFASLRSLPFCGRTVFNKINLLIEKNVRPTACIKSGFGLDLV